MSQGKEQQNKTMLVLVLLGALLSSSSVSCSGIFELNLSALTDAYGRDLRLDCCAWQNNTTASAQQQQQQQQQQQNNNIIQANSVSGRFAASSAAAAAVPAVETCDPSKCHMIIRICVKNYQTQIDPSQCTFGELTAQVARPEWLSAASAATSGHINHHHHHAHHHQQQHFSTSSLARLQQQQQQQLKPKFQQQQQQQQTSQAANIHHQRMLLQQLQQVPYLTPAAAVGRTSGGGGGSSSPLLLAAPRAMRQVNLQEPISFPFNFTWPGAFSLVIDAWFESATGLQQLVGGGYQSSALQSRLALHQAQAAAPATSYDLYKKQLIIQLSMNGWLSVNDDWKNGMHKTDTATLAYSYRVSCQPNYFGEQCNILCRPRDDVYGHFVCSESGDVRCLPGWQGKYCEEPVCAPGCHSAQGNCTLPGECNCRLGWQGPACEQCVRAVGCVHGTCQRPNECNCQEGWGGLLCNEDLRYCTNHQPCKNGALCTNTFDLTGVGSYTCTCEEGFAGKNCERRAGDPEHQIPAAAAAAHIAPTAHIAPPAGANQTLNGASTVAITHTSATASQQQQQPPPYATQQHQSGRTLQQQNNQQVRTPASKSVLAQRQFAPQGEPTSTVAALSPGPQAAALDHRVMVAYGIIIVCMVILVVLLLLRVFFERLSGAVVGCGTSGSSGAIWPASQMITAAGEEHVARHSRRAGRQRGDSNDTCDARHRSRSSSRHRNRKYGHHNQHHLSTRSLAPNGERGDVATLQNHANIYKSRASIATDKVPVFSSPSSGDETCSTSSGASSSTSSYDVMAEMRATQHHHQLQQQQQHYSASAHYGPIGHHYHHHYNPYSTHQQQQQHYMPISAAAAQYHHLAPAHSVHSLGQAAAAYQRLNQQQQQQQQPPPPPYTISGTSLSHAYGAVGAGASANPIYSSQSTTYAPAATSAATYGNYHPAAASMILAAGPPHASHAHPNPSGIYTSHSTYGTAATLAAHCVSSGLYGGLSGAASTSALPHAAGQRQQQHETTSAATKEQQAKQRSDESTAATATGGQEENSTNNNASPYGNLQAAQAATATRETSATTQQQQQQSPPDYFFTSTQSHNNSSNSNNNNNGQ